jgi:ABC-2 type transport system ATP-binding protein
MIVVDHVVKSFPMTYSMLAWLKHRGSRPRNVVLHDICLAVGRGELFGLLGPNGAGKTTLLKLLATLALPDAGTITIDGIDTGRDPKAAKRRIGLCTSEERSFYFRLSARANLEYFGALVGLSGPALSRRIKEVLEIVDLSGSIDGRFDSYSSGMRQRLTVARALLADPDVLFLDEPTRAVDPVHAEAIRHLIQHELVKRRGKTVILATNLLEEAWRLCDRVAVLNRGSVVALGPPHSLDKQLRQVMRYQLTVDKLDQSLVDVARALPGLTQLDVEPSAEGVMLRIEMEKSQQSLNELFRVISLNGTVLRAVRTMEPDPVEVFKRVTAADHNG